jgi:hypothetical protein
MMKSHSDFQTFPIESRDQWLALRETDVTASVAAALFGVHRYHSWYSLWALKTGQIVEDPDETPAMRRGRMLEQVAVDFLLEDYPDWRIENPNVYIRDPKVRLGATPDRYIYRPDRPGFGVLQIKTVEESLFKKTWLNENREIEPPLWIAIQAEVERHLSGANYAMVAVLRAGFGIDCTPIDIPAVNGLMKKVEENVALFWWMIDHGKRPDPDYSKDGKTIEALWAGNGSSAVLDLRSDNALVALADEKERLAAEGTAIDKRKKEIKAELLHRLGTASAGEIADGRIITAKKVEKAAYSVKASSYIDVRVKMPK